MDDAEYLFLQEQIEKKKTSYGAKHRASRKKGFKGGVKTPVDYLKGKARKNYMNNGKVVSYNMYENTEEKNELSAEYLAENMTNIYSLTNLNATKEKKGLILKYLCDRYGLDETARRLKCKKQKIYDLRRLYEVTDKHLSRRTQSVKEASVFPEVKLEAEGLVIKADEKLVQQIKVEKEDTKSIDDLAPGEHLSCPLEDMAIDMSNVPGYLIKDLLDRIFGSIKTLDMYDFSTIIKKHKRKE